MSNAAEDNDKKPAAKTKPLITNNLDVLPWVEKYRPSSLSELVAHEDIISILTKLIDTDNLPHLLLYGPPGTGKTSTIVAAAKRMYGSNAKYKSMTLELNASDARGINVVRDQIKEFAGTRQLFHKGGIKLIILDEADSMTNDAQFALRRIIEKYTKNARFCMICNYVSKIIPALQSRCTRFRFAPLSCEQIRGRLEDVAKREKCITTPGGINAILELANGDMRRVLNLLQSTHMCGDVNQITVYETAGAPLPNDMKSILDFLLNHSFRKAVEEIVGMCSIKGYALTDVLHNLTNMIIAMDFPPAVLAELLDGMSNVEHRLASGTDEKLQAGSLVGVFTKARLQMTPVAVE